jgi:SAM-dependent methyltransferase
MTLKKETVAAPIWPQRLSQIDSQVDEIHLPAGEDHVEQDAEWCEVVVEGDRRKFRFHDYDEIYEVPGLYEELFYGRLKCCSPSRVVRLLQDVLRDFNGSVERLRVLDLGAGNGMVGDELAARGVRRIVGVDVLPEAREAARRDRAGIYEQYFVVDLSDLPEPMEKRLSDLRLNCLTSVAALGFGDIPPEAFIKAFNLIETGGWIALTIKEDFLYESDNTGFCRLVRRLNREKIMQTHAYRRYRHRFSITGEPLHYVAMVSRKRCEIPADLLCEEWEPAQA